jgi:hypothetical protein
MVADIPVPPTFNMQHCDENVLRVIWGNTDVQNALRGKEQKQLDYRPGEAYITTTDNISTQVHKDFEEQVNNIAEQNQQQNQTEFSMGGPNNPVATTYMNPSEMVNRLNGAVKRGKKNE